ncbi:MAG: TM0106 family RecB-like putative nuclease [Ilumatobacter sp.]|nr:TM0106 family RecB-like putative nuclease [Ilumatobacter sp.]
MTEHARPDVPLLGAYAAKQCPYRLFREHDPTEAAVPAPPDDALQELFDDGIAFEASIGEELVELHGDAVAVIPGRSEAEPDERRALTDAALAAGTPIILGALMQRDTTGRRLGEIDVLLRVGDRYRPIDVKHHRCTTNADEDSDEAEDTEEAADGLSTPVQTLDLLGPAVAVAGLEAKYREDDCLQLAHYYRMLQAHGYAEPHAVGGIIGTERVVAWFDLESPRFSTLTPQQSDGAITYHRRHRTTKRTALDRYDFEFDFRLRVVDEAIERRDRSASPPVLPVSVVECTRCPWHDPCHADMEAVDDVSLVKPVGYPEWSVHRFMGVTTVTQLAALDPATYVDTPLTEHALVNQIRSAQAAVAGQMLIDPDWDESLVPRADVEIDLDLENAARVYLWGARLSRVPDDWPEPAGSYTAFASFDELDDVGEAELVARLWAWLDDIGRRAAGRTVRIYGYSIGSTEVAALRRIAAGGAVPGLPSIDDVMALPWVDLLPLMRRKYWSNWGHGLKVVAAAAGFAWRDDDPGGYASMGWYRDAVAGVDREANIARLLMYNEDDCAATAALRVSP